MENAKTPEELTAALEASKKELETIKQRNAEEQKKLTDLATENATLRKRQEDIGQEAMVQRKQAEVAQVSEEVKSIMAEQDPNVAATKWASLLDREKSNAADNAVREFLPKVEDYINKKDYMNNMRREHPEFKDVEALMAPAIEAKIRTKKISLEKAMEETMNEFKPFINKSQPVTAGASGFQGANPIPRSSASSAEPEIVYRDFKEHSTIETVSEIEERKAWQKGKHIIKKVT